jgi:hypothetical protein
MVFCTHRSARADYKTVTIRKGVILLGKKKRRPQQKKKPVEQQTPAVEQVEQEEIAPPIEAEPIDPETLVITDGYDYEQRAIDRRLTELGQMREEVAMERREWLRSHRMTFIVIASVLIITLIFIMMKVYNDANNPLSRFISASGKNLGSSFHFRITAEKDGEDLMTYDGVMKAEPSGQRVEIEYKADYPAYSYRNVIYTYNGETDKGNYYNGQWTLSSVTDKVSDFFDFYTDYRVGRFDGGSFLRFTELSSEFSSSVLTDFVHSLRGRFATDSPAARITIDPGDDGSTAYRYDLSLITIAEIIRDEGASAFFRSSDYDSFVAKLEANRESIEDAECAVLYTITPSGYLSSLEIDFSGAQSSYVLRCEMSDFGTAEPDIPDDFYQFADIEIKE